MKKSVLHFFSTIRLCACLFALPYLLYLAFRVFRLKAMRAACLCGGCFSLFAFYLCVSASSADASVSSPPASDVHICQILDYEDMRARDSLYAATKQALNLNVGEPRTVRMIYFLPNDRPFQQGTGRFLLRLR